MKLKTSIYLLLIVVAFVFVSCNQKFQGTASSISSEDSMKIAFYDHYFKGNEKSILDTRVNYDSAKHSVKIYKDLTISLKPKDIKKMLETESVSFKLANLQPWLDSLKNYTDATELRICFGIYTTEFLASVGKPKKNSGKLTVFLWPYNGNTEAVYLKKEKQTSDKVEPFNFGELYP